MHTLADITHVSVPHWSGDLDVHVYIASPPTCTATEGPVRIQYKCLVPIYVFPELKLLFPKQNYNVLSPSSSTHISVRNLHISRFCQPILLQDRSWEYINRSQAHECGNWDWGRAIPRKGIHKWDFRGSVCCPGYGESNVKLRLCDFRYALWYLCVTAEA
jgi:hypothetical protein